MNQELLDRVDEWEKDTDGFCSHLRQLDEKVKRIVQSAHPQDQTENTSQSSDEPNYTNIHTVATEVKHAVFATDLWTTDPRPPLDRRVSLDLSIQLSKLDLNEYKNERSSPSQLTTLCDQFSLEVERTCTWWTLKAMQLKPKLDEVEEFLFHKPQLLARYRVLKEATGWLTYEDLAQDGQLWRRKAGSPTKTVESVKEGFMQLRNALREKFPHLEIEVLQEGVRMKRNSSDTSQ